MGGRCFPTARPRPSVSDGFCLDAGVLIAIERGHPRVLTLLEGAIARGLAVEVPAGVLAQVWRGGARQSRLARFLRSEGVAIAELDHHTAMAVGALCGSVGASDIVDGHVALHAVRRGLAVITSDPDDIRAFGPRVEIVVV